MDSGGSKSWLFVKLETNDGLIGWGEAYTQADRDGAMLAHITEMGRYLVGRSAFAIKHFASVMHLELHATKAGLDWYSALSGIEQAMCDIVGKACGQPVYNLLGGPCRERIRVYANGWSERAREPDEYARCAAEVVARGFAALKFDPFSNPWRTHVGRDEEELAVERVRAVREAVGPKVEILVALHRRLAPNEAIRVAKRLEQFEPFWYEEPVDADDIEGLAEVRGEDFPTGGYGRGTVQQMPIRTPRRGYPEPRCLQLRRDRGAQGDRRDGGTVARHRFAAQLQQHHDRACRHAAGGGVHAELPDH